jgi:modified peptide precursor CbpA
MKAEKKTAPKVIRKANGKKDVVASRRSCDVKGTGLSHYVLMGAKKK